MASFEKNEAPRKNSSEKIAVQRKLSAEKTTPQRKASVEKHHQNSEEQTNGNQQQFNNKGNKNFEQNFEVIITSLSFDASEEDIRNHFSKCPNLKFVKMMMGQDGRFRGKAFLKFSTEDGMNEALKLNESFLLNRKINVELTENMKGGNQQNNRFDQRQPNNNFNQQNNEGEESTSVMVRNLSWTVDEVKLQNVFSGCGPIRSSRVCKDETGKSRGFGFVDFTSLDASKKAITKTNEKIDGRAITVCYSIKKDRNAPRPNQGYGNNNSQGGNRQFFGEKKGNTSQFQGEAVDLD